MLLAVHLQLQLSKCCKYSYQPGECCSGSNASMFLKIVTIASVGVANVASVAIIWASLRENLSSGFPSKRDSNQSPQLQRRSRKSKFHP